MKCYAVIKKWLAIALGVLLAVGLSACGSSRQAESDASHDAEQTHKSGTQANTPNQSANSTQKPEKTDPQQEKNTDVAVVVFSATGTTKGVADKIASVTDANVIEIIPAQSYSAEDLNYNDSGSRTSKEQNDPNARPEIAKEIALDGYKTVYLGYPIWWGQAPRILSTFVESHNFTGITVIPFCTSGSSDIGQSDNKLAEQAGSGNWLQGKRFSGNVTESDLQKWIKDFEKSELAGTLFCGGITDPGEANGKETKLNEAYTFGKGMD